MKTVLAGYLLWPLAHIINFKFIPADLRILYVNWYSSSPFHPVWWACYSSVTQCSPHASVKICAELLIRTGYRLQQAVPAHKGRLMKAGCCATLYTWNDMWGFGAERSAQMMTDQAVRSLSTVADGSFCGAVYRWGGM